MHEETKRPKGFMLVRFWQREGMLSVVPEQIINPKDIVRVFYKGCNNTPFVVLKTENDKTNCYQLWNLRMESFSKLMTEALEEQKEWSK